MPKRELKFPQQIMDWLGEWGSALSEPGSMVLIGSGGLLFHAALSDITTPLPENSMDVDPITSDENVARLGYDALIGSEFELKHGWHVNLMPEETLLEFPDGWKKRAATQKFKYLSVTVPAPADLLSPKLRRGEPRDLKHAMWAIEVGLVSSEELGIQKNHLTEMISKYKIPSKRKKVSKLPKNKMRSR